MKNEGVPIVREGLPFLLVSGIATVAFGVAGIWPAFVIFCLLTAFIAYFFRNPERLAPVGRRLVASPADGKVIFAGEATEQEFSKAKSQKISIFMSVFDVHVNRVPVDGTVKDIRYHRGRFMAAFEDRASEENERNALLIETPKGHQVVLTQIAGLIARRIVCYPSAGTFILKGQRIGLIRFGSRCDIFFPPKTELLVKVGDRVQGGESAIARLEAKGDDDGEE